MKARVLKGIVYSVALICLTLGFLWLAACIPSSAKSEHLNIHITAGSTDRIGNVVCSVVVSNASLYPANFRGGFGVPWFDIAYFTNNLWRSTHVWTPGGGDGILGPHEAMCSVVHVPNGASAVKVGLTFTSLTWRGRVAWWTSARSFSDILRPVTVFLWHQDKKWRSKVDWSNEFNLLNTNATNH
jgi:hypothetical protein